MIINKRLIALLQQFRRMTSGTTAKSGHVAQWRTPMTPLTQEFVDSCPKEGVFRMRGLEMTRIEVFVDAAFAFA
jgi:hypothetical protein